MRYESFETSKRTASDEHLREELLRKLVDRQLFGPTQQILMETDIEKLPFRELPPGNMSSLYLLYLAYVRSCEGGSVDSRAASKSTFYSVSRLWSHCLKFRRKSEHSMCLVCSKLKTAIRETKDSMVVRKWTDIVPDQVTFKNAFRVRKLKDDDDDQQPVPHSFTFMKRSGMPSNVQTSERLPRALQDPTASQDDVFALVKSEMSSASLCQEPLLVYPGSLVGQSKHFLRCANTTTLVEPCCFDTERKDEIEKLAKAISRDFPSMRRAVNWYQGLLQRTPEDQPEPYPVLTFLRNAPAEGERWHEFHLGPRPVPPKPHNLQVVFHRG
eukprot:Skav223873  [mRNA]  locus=scaffold1226:282372:284660:+ [translate_table: standard]